MAKYYFICTTSTGKPGKPGVPDIKAQDKTQITLCWTPPKTDGGSPIIHYTVEYRAENAFKWKQATDETSLMSDTTYIVKNLRENEIYEFRIAAQNKAGQGPFSENTMPVKAEVRIG